VGDRDGLGEALTVELVEPDAPSGKAGVADAEVDAE
jgi:hypothetical protein